MKNVLVRSALVAFVAGSIYLQWKVHEYDFTTSAAALKPRELIGRRAPEFELAQLDGGKHHISDYRGKIVVIDFWATWCGPCRRSMPMLEKLQEDNQDALVVLAVNLRESEDDVRSFIQQQNLHCIVLMDDQGTTGSTYHADAIPMQVVVGPDGVVKDVQVGFSPLLPDIVKRQIAAMGKPK